PELLIGVLRHPHRQPRGERRRVPRVILVPVRDHDAARTKLPQRSLEVGRHVRKPRVYQHATHEVGADVVSDRAAAPGPHAQPEDVVEPDGFDHADWPRRGLDWFTRDRYNASALRWRPADPSGRCPFFVPGGPAMIEELKRKLASEAEKLQHELNVILPNEIRKAVELGDLRENSEYKAALERQQFV